MATQAHGFVEGQTCSRGNTSKQLNEADPKKFTKPKSKPKTKTVRLSRSIFFDLGSDSDSDGEQRKIKIKVRRNENEKIHALYCQLNKKPDNQRRKKMYQSYFASFSANPEARQYGRISRKLTVDTKLKLLYHFLIVSITFAK